MLKHNIGKDVSKFFYGGYSLDGNEMGVNANGHFHSNFARKLVNRLAIAQYESFNASVETCKLTVKDRITVTTHTFRFKVAEKKPVEHFRSFYPGLRDLGKNFLVSNVPEQGEQIVSRQYSICYSVEEAM